MRVFYNSTEITKETERIDSTYKAISYVSGSYIYIATDFPFNHLYIKLGTIVNIVASTNMSVEYYGTSWNSVVELRDETIGLSASGGIEFTPNRDVTWTRAVYSSDAGVTPVLYQKYWTRISFDKTLTPSLSLSFIGNKFSDDNDLYAEYPVFNDSNYLSAFKSGKTDWEEQHIKASDLIIQDLQKKGVILGPEQVLDKRKFLGASVCKTAEIIYTAFGNDYIEQRKAAASEYSKRLDLSQFNTDMNNNAILEVGEVMAKQGWLSR